MMSWCETFIAYYAQLHFTTYESAAAVVQFRLLLAFRGAGREECNVFEQLSHAVIFSQHKEPN